MHTHAYTNTHMHHVSEDGTWHAQHLLPALCSTYPLFSMCLNMLSLCIACMVDSGLSPWRLKCLTRVSHVTSTHAGISSLVSRPLWASSLSSYLHSGSSK